MSFIYRGLKAELRKHTVTDAEVDAQLQRLQQQTPRYATVNDRPTKVGDEVVLDYAGFCGGEQFAGGTAQYQTLVLGSGTFIPGFEEQLLDKVPGENVTVHVTFPQQYHSADLAGKEAEFRCVIHEIRTKSMYELDDVFAKEVGECGTFAEMREKLRQSLQSYTDDRGEMDLQDRLIRQAADTLQFPITDAMEKEATDELIANLTVQLGQQGLTLQMYCQFMGVTEEKLREDMRATARQNVRVNAAVEQIVDLENLEATAEEMGQAINAVCRQNNMTLEELKPYYDAEFEAAIRRSVLTGKALRLVRDAAEITEIQE